MCGSGVGVRDTGKEILEVVDQWSHLSDGNVDPQLKAAVLNLRSQVNDGRLGSVLSIFQSLMEK